MYIQILAKLGLADVRKVAPKLRKSEGKSAPDLATLQAVITHRYQVATAYARTLNTACRAELAALRTRVPQDEAKTLPSVGRVKRWLTTDPSGWSPLDREHMESTVARSQTLAKIVAMRTELAALWERSTESSEQLLARLQDWCHRAEASGIPPLAQFSLQLRRYN
jgi:stearoyl-CoA desaturase (delta-9 desaturase)